MNLGGVRNLQRPPDAIFIVDLKTEAIGVREAERLRIPIIGLVDTNVDPEPTTFPIPGNDDAIRSCKLIVDAIADVVGERHPQFRAEEEDARKEAEEKARTEAEEKARREAEEQAAPGGRGAPRQRGAQAEAARAQAAGRRRRRRAGPARAAARRSQQPEAAAPSTPEPREELERAERDAKAPAASRQRPRGGEEADVKASRAAQSARPDQEVG